MLRVVGRVVIIHREEALTSISNNLVLGMKGDNELDV
jgi:hypothetical protein